MKKIIYLAALVLSVVGISACSGNKSCDGRNSCDGAGCSKKGDLVYTGVLPAADCEGIRYTLKLDYDDNNRKGDYNLVETYLIADSTSTTGLRDKSFLSEGDFNVVARDGKDYLQLIQDVKDSMQGSATTMNFLVESDSTLVMVNSDFQKPETPGLNYTLKLVK